MTQNRLEYLRAVLLVYAVGMVKVKVPVDLATKQEPEEEESSPPTRADRFTWYADDVVVEEE